MNFLESMVQEVLADARIPGAKARQEVAEELTNHLEELSVEAYRQGCEGARVEAFVRNHFGEPAVVGREFARIYRFERIRLYASVGLAVAALLAGAAIVSVYAVQRWLALKLDLESTMSARHFSREVLLIAVAVCAYTTIVAVTRWIPPRRTPLILGGIAAVVLLGLMVWLFPGAGRVMSLGVFFSLVMYGAESCFRAWGTRLSANWLAASIAGVILATFVMTDASRPLAFTVPMWLVIALAMSTAASTAGTLGIRIIDRRFAA